MNDFSTEQSFADQLDRNDPLARFRERFYVQPGTIYMLGNSLGLMSEAAEKTLSRVMDEWKRLAIGGWLEGEQPWFYYAEALGEKAAGLMGAAPSEVVATGTTTTNIHSLVSSLYRPSGDRTKILADALNFPTDLYALRSQVELRGLDPERHLILMEGDPAGCLDEGAIIDQMTDDVAVAFFPSVLYRSGQLLDMERLAGEARRRNILIGFDCSHSAGVVPHQLDAWGVDFAVWCSYKYLNGGPGGVGFLYVNQRHFDQAPGLAGWFGYVKDRQFELRVDFEPARNAGGWQISAPGILNAAVLEGALDIIQEAGIKAIRAKSITLTSYLRYLIEQLLPRETSGISIITPRDPSRRGGHIAITHPQEGFRICQALKENGIVTDFRPPDIIRFAPSPLYNSFGDVHGVVQVLKTIMDEKSYESYPAARKAIT